MVWETYRDKIRSLALKIVRHREDAEDVVQNVGMALVRNLEKFRGECALTSWIYRITFNEGLMFLRRRRSLKFCGSCVAENEDPDAWLKALEEAYFNCPERGIDARRCLEEICRGLRTKPHYLRVLKLSGSGYATPEIEAAIGLSHPAVKSRLHRAKTAARRIYRRFQAREAINS